MLNRDYYSNKIIIYTYFDTKHKFTLVSNSFSYLTGTIGGGNGTDPTQRLTQPSKQQSPRAGQSVSLTPGLQQVLTLPAHDDPKRIGYL